MNIEGSVYIYISIPQVEQMRCLNEITQYKNRKQEQELSHFNSIYLQICSYSCAENALRMHIKYKNRIPSVRKGIP